jgi:DNA mismatch endonuclease (patch repair protein)
MKGNRSQDTRPEIRLRSALHRRGHRFRKDFRVSASIATCRVDLAFTARRVAVFVDGCFWHCCPDHGTLPVSNTEYWHPKLARNVERDRSIDRALREAGWTVVRVWEHEPVDAAVAQVETAIQS